MKFQWHLKHWRTIDVKSHESQSIYKFECRATTANETEIAPKFLMEVDFHAFQVWSI